LRQTLNKKSILIIDNERIILLQFDTTATQIRRIKIFVFFYPVIFLRGMGEMPERISSAYYPTALAISCFV